MQLTVENLGEPFKIQEPMPSEHACRLRDPGDFQDDSFRRYSRKTDGKTYDVIGGRLEGEDTMTEQTYRYPKDAWTAAAARAHCGDADGSFEAASGEAVSENEIEGDLVPLSERAVQKDGLVDICIVKPGWGSSGYYSPELLRRDGPKMFPRGLHMHWNHPTEAEERERPEGSLSTLAGTLETNAEWKPKGRSGPGIYAKAKIFTPYQPVLEEIAPHIGVSLRGRAKAKEGSAEGREGAIIQELTQMHSVDYVTLPAAGGHILQVFESVGRKSDDEGDDSMELKEQVAALEAEVETLRGNLKVSIDKLAVVEVENARLKETAVIAEAGKIVAAKLAETKLPDITKARLAPTLGANPPTKDGALDKVVLEAAIAAAVTGETEYIAKLRGDGKIVGMGDPSLVEGVGLKEAFIGMYRSMGETEERAKQLAGLSV